MAKKEAKTDLWVYELLQEANIKLTPQGCDIKEINEALKTASKSNTGNAGYPEYCGVVKDFILVIEDKASLDKHLYKDEKGIIAQDVKAVKNYAVNGALFYARHLATKTSYNKVLAIGVSGNEKHHRITPIFVNERDDYQVLSDVETFISFSKNNIDEYYYREILHEKTDSEKTTQEVLKDAATLHEYLRSYGQPTTDEKPLIVSGIMLALREIEHGSFSIENLNGDVELTDGQKIYNAIETNLKRANVTPETKRDKLFAQFAFIKNKVSLNEHNEKLGKTPLRYYTEFLYKNIFHNIRYNSSSEDYIGRFYGEFMSYSGEDGQTLGIVLTPKHITDLFCDLIDLKADDKVLDPCCGTGGFLIAAMHRMINLTDNNAQRRHIKKEQLYGIEIQDKMFAIATTNMILRGDGNSNLQPLDFLRQNPHLLQQKGCTVGMINPPYSQAQKTKNTELRMTKKKLPVRFTGQHFTIDKVLIKDAIRQANISNQDTVLDIGAGKGFLTVHLLKIANNVVAIENDTALVEHLRKLFSDARNVQVVGCDFRNFAVPKFPFKVVSNIPYGITSDIFKILMFESLGNFLGGSIVLQLEPTQKLFSRKLYNPYTVFYHTFFDLKLVYEVGPESFFPPPTVKSALLNIKRKQLFFDFKFKAKYLAFISCLLEKPDLSVKTALKSIFRKSQVRSISEKFGLNLNAQIVCLSPSQWVNCFLEMLEVVPEKFHPS